MSKVISLTDKKPSFQLKSKGKKSAELTIYGSIGEDIWSDTGITAKKVIDAIKDFGEIENLDVRINSMGGDVFEGVTIYNRLKQMKANITVYVDGLAASIASIIAMAGDEIILSEGSLMMVHSPMTFAYGNQREFQNKIEILDTIEEEMLGIYSRRTGMPRSEIRNLLHSETWLNAQEALESGFATSISEEESIAACSDKDLLKFSKMYKNCPKDKIITDSKVIKNKLKNSIKNVEDLIARKKA
jgi:ATP-dependent Clp protease, protease subunit